MLDETQRERDAGRYCCRFWASRYWSWISCFFPPFLWAFFSRLKRRFQNIFGMFCWSWTWIAKIFCTFFFPVRIFFAIKAYTNGISTKNNWKIVSKEATPDRQPFKSVSNGKKMPTAFNTFHFANSSPIAMEKVIRKKSLLLFLLLLFLLLLLLLFLLLFLLTQPIRTALFNLLPVAASKREEVWYIHYDCSRGWVLPPLPAPPSLPSSLPSQLTSIWCQRGVVPKREEEEEREQWFGREREGGGRWIEGPVAAALCEEMRSMQDTTYLSRCVWVFLMINWATVAFWGEHEYSGPPLCNSC